MHLTIARVLLSGSLLAGTAAAGDGPRYQPTDAERARWTMQDMRSIGICMEAYKRDQGTYPVAANLTELRALVEPAYVKVLPVRDAWGNEYRLTSARDGYRVASGGADGRVDEKSWDVRAEQADFSSDAVLETGLKFVRPWQYK